MTGLAYSANGTRLGNLTYAYDAFGRRMAAGGSLAAADLSANVAGGTGTAYNADNEPTKFNGVTQTGACPVRRRRNYNGNLTADGTNTYTWDARNQLGALAGGATANLLTGLGIDEYFTRTDACGTMAFMADALGSTVGLVNAAGGIDTSYTYQPFGATTVNGTSANPYQFTGRENDGAGLYFYRARYYSPTFQRFIAQDPIGFKGGDANLYAYVHDSPPVLTDSFGTCGGTPQNPRCNPFFLTYETALYIGYDTFKGFGYGGAIGLGTGLIVGVPEVGGLLGAGLGTIGGGAYGAYQAIQNIEADCQF